MNVAQTGKASTELLKIEADIVNMMTNTASIHFYIVPYTVSMQSH